ncbi:MAG: FKBP-type peptidyl-prolyl cis-trans isomerase [Bacteroidales bacterium]|nr:FKBP-type peptidyl-prolyl cis-trans isomerase [Bacteroidales bacterium]
MRKIVICAAVAATVILAAGCAKTLSSGTNEQSQRYYNAWVKVKQDAHPEYLWLPISYGTTDGSDVSDYAYLLEEIEGDGEEVLDSNYIFLNYTSYDLAGTVQSTTDRVISHRTGVNYDQTYYYGPTIYYNTDYYLTIGIKDVICGVKDGEDCYGRMKVGGTRKAVIPGWLSVSTRYSDISGFLNNATGTDLIYDMTVTDQTDDINQYQIDSIESYFYRKYKTRDSAYTGFYYKSLDAPITEVVYPDDTTIYVNYIGRLLNGQVFDTNIDDTAKVWNLYDDTNTYEPAAVNWSSDSSAVTLSSSDVITGFGSIITRMGWHEKAVGVFYSNLGYGSSGSGYLIPPYAPLEFEIRIVEDE